MAKSKASKPKILKPFMVMLAVMTSWAAMHQPDQFSLGDVGVWALSAFTVGLLARAALALLGPVLSITGAIFERSLKSLPHDGADS